MKNAFTTFWTLLKNTAAEWSKDRVPKLSAALAYYTVFSLAPLLLLIIGVTSLFLERKAATGELMAQLTGLVGPRGAQAVEQILNSSNAHTGGWIASIVGLVTILLGATGVFVELQDSLNAIWGVEAPKGEGIWHAIMSRFRSFAIVLAIGFLLIVSLVVSAVLAAVSKFLEGYLPGATGTLWMLANLGISFGIITLLFATIFKVLPDTAIRWRDVWVGALVTSFLFTLGKTLIGLYLGRSSVTNVFGAAASFAIILLWVYYSAQILFFGAEFTKVYARRFNPRHALAPSGQAAARVDASRGQGTLRPSFS